MQTWSKLVIRTRWFWIIAWPIAAFLVWWPAPSIPTLLHDDGTGSLPADLPSERAFSLLRSEFPEHSPASGAAIVFRRAAGLTQGDREQIDTIALELQKKSSELNWRVTSAVTSPFVRPLLESADGQAAVVAIDLPAEMLTHSTVNRVREVQKVVTAAGIGGGLEAHVTGSGALAELLDRDAKKDVDRTTFWTFVGVAVILLLVYRSLVGLALPIVTIAVSLLLSLGLIGWAASWGLPINGLLELFVIVVLVGSGIDYCLFLFGRFLEARSAGAEIIEAVEIALANTGGAVLASAGTNIAGFSVLIFAKHRDLYTSGPAIAFTLIIAASAVLTLAPALMIVVGQMFARSSKSPAQFNIKEAEARGVRSRQRNSLEGADLGRRKISGLLWGYVARVVTRYPTVVVSAVLLSLIPLSVVGAKVKPLYDSFEEYPASSSFVRGAKLYARHFFQCGHVGEMTLLVTRAAANPWRGGDIESLALDRLAAALESRFPVIYQRDLSDPLGNRRTKQPASQSLATDESANFDESTNGSTGVLAALTSQISTEAARNYYVGASGSTMRIDLGLAIEPRSTAAMDLLPALRTAVAGELSANTGSPVEVHVSGETAAYADLRDLRSRDFRVIAVASTLLIFLILLQLTRSIAQSAILIGATVLTYLATYGLTWLVFHFGFGVTSLNWQVNFFLFIVILSLGQDYNIFVVSRIREELKRIVSVKPGELARTTGNPVAHAIERAICQTGGVVSSCGIVMAAAFGSMFTGSLLLMKEMAVAIAAGILIDTFVIRPLLVPAMILLLTRRAGIAMAKKVNEQTGQKVIPSRPMQPAPAIKFPKRKPVAEAEEVQEIST